MKSLRTMFSDLHAPGSHRLFLDFVETSLAPQVRLEGGWGGGEGEILIISQQGMLCVSLLKKRCLEREVLERIKTSLSHSVLNKILKTEGNPCPGLAHIPRDSIGWLASISKDLVLEVFFSCIYTFRSFLALLRFILLSSLLGTEFGINK